jgi:hypothetical protein
MFRRDAKNPKLAKLARVLLDLDILKDADAPDLPHVTESTLVGARSPNGAVRQPVGRLPCSTRFASS